MNAAKSPLALTCATSLVSPLIHATVSRLVLDLNRDPSAPDSIWTLSERTTIPGNQDLDPAERANRVREVYDAFHGAVDQVVGPRVQAGQTRAIVSIHSFTPIYRDVPRPWKIGLIHDKDERFARSVSSSRSRVTPVPAGAVRHDMHVIDRVGPVGHRPEHRVGVGRIDIVADCDDDLAAHLVGDVVGLAFRGEDLVTTTSAGDGPFTVPSAMSKAGLNIMTKSFYIIVPYASQGSSATSSAMKRAGKSPSAVPRAKT